MRQLIVAFCLFTIFNSQVQAQNTKKSDIKILYVGQNPEKGDGYSFLGAGSNDAWNTVRQERAKVFYEFFLEYFEEVKLVYGENYKEHMSDKYDVTVFDALPPRPDGSESNYMPPYPNAPKFISDDYDAATVLIAGVGGALMKSRNNKIDWACNCLYDYAYNIIEEHPVFNTPYKVDMTKEPRKHKSSVFMYYSGRNLPKGEVPMLRIQNVDQFEHYPPGIVSSPGFEDSPDGEFICGGPNSKSFNAVALGRQGNFFQWGFRADPRHLTQTGKLALINAIHYIKDFKGQKPFVKRKSYHRLMALDQVYKASDIGYEYAVKNALRIHEAKNEAKARKLAGKETPSDKAYINLDSQFPDRTAYIKNVPPEIVEKYVSDWNAYLKYYEDNIGYLGLSEVKEGFYGRKHYDIVLDKDLQKLGVANNDIKLLETCVKMLERAEQAALAQKLLERYTTQKFTTAKQWEKWLKKNKGNLFFTERGGYKWMVNPY